jgi:phosphoglucosamine mutase
MRKLPQALLNVPVADRSALADAPTVDDALESESSALDGRGRVLLRPSGTESVIRVMVEAPTQEEADRVAARLAAVVERELGA